MTVKVAVSAEPYDTLNQIYSFKIKFPNKQKYHRQEKKTKVYSIAERVLIDVLYTIPQNPGMHQAVQRQMLQASVYVPDLYIPISP